MEASVVVPVVLGCIGLVVLVALVIAAFIFLRRRQRRKPKEPESEPEPESNLLPMAPVKQAEPPVKSIMSNIDIKERIGGGNFGDVYRGLWNVNKQ